MCVTTSAFLERMEGRWVGFGNVPSLALRNSWGQMCQVLNDKVIISCDPKSEESWSILCPPTGSGKTQGMIVYAAMHSLPNVLTHPGMLIVSRLIDDTDKIAEQINSLSRSYNNNEQLPDQAISYHSKKKGKVRMDELASYPVLVVTHEAYKIALDMLNRNARIEDTWEYFYTFQDKQRKLVVIDEAIDLVDYDEIQEDAISALLHFSKSLADKFPRERMWIQGLEQVFIELNKRTNVAHKEMILVDKPTSEWFSPESLQLMAKCGMDETEQLDFTSFKQALKEISYDSMLFKRDAMENMRLYQKCMDITSSIDSLFKSFIFYSKNQTKPTFNTARLLVPPDIKGAVIFDATATSNPVYDVFDRAQLILPPKGTRSYSNATIHYSYGHKVGQREMKKNGLKLSTSLITSLDEQFSGDDGIRRKVLIITHKAVEPFMLLPENKPKNFDMAVAHYGAVDGSNDWQEYDAVVVFGLPYKPQRWSPSIFMALQGVQDTLWFHEPGRRSFKHHVDIRKAMDTGQMLSDIIQGINRVRCRRVIDDEGNCPTTDIFLLLPDASDSQEILEGIKKAMPGVNSTEWFYQHQKRKKNGRPSGSYDESLIAYLENLQAGDRVSSTSVKKVLNIKDITWKRIQARLVANDSDDFLCVGLQTAKVIYQGGQGKGKQTFFIKTI